MGSCVSTSRRVDPTRWIWLAFDRTGPNNHPYPLARALGARENPPPRGGVWGKPRMVVFLWSSKVLGRFGPGLWGNGSSITGEALLSTLESAIDRVCGFVREPLGSEPGDYTYIPKQTGIPGPFFPSVSSGRTAPPPAVPRPCGQVGGAVLLDKNQRKVGPWITAGLVYLAGP